MRIADEKKKFKIGDSVVLIEKTNEHNVGDVGVVGSIIATSNYYEHRPIACYFTWTYVVCINEDKLYLSGDKLDYALKNIAEAVII